MSDSTAQVTQHRFSSTTQAVQHRFLRFAGIALAKTLLVVGVALLIARGVDIGGQYLSQYWEGVKNNVMRRIGTVEIVREYVKPNDVSTESLIKTLSHEYNVSPILTLAIGHQESGKGLRNDRLRFEPKVFSRFSKQYPDEISRMMASSIGIMQVIPAFHMKRCNLTSYADLFDRETNIRCGLKVLTDCLNQSRAGTKVAKFKDALACYNGSDTYADEVFSRLGELALENNLL